MAAARTAWMRKGRYADAVISMGERTLGRREGRSARWNLVLSCSPARERRDRREDCRPCAPAQGYEGNLGLKRKNQSTSTIRALFVLVEPTPSVSANSSV